MHLYQWFILCPSYVLNSLQGCPAKLNKSPACHNNHPFALPQLCEAIPIESQLIDLGKIEDH